MDMEDEEAKGVVENFHFLHLLNQEGRDASEVLEMLSRET